MLDVFSGDLYGVVSLTSAMNKLPYKPGRIGSMGLFRKQGIRTTSAMVEERQGKLALVPTAARGAPGAVIGGIQRKARSFPIPHMPYEGYVMADDVQNVRAFGKESDTEGVMELVNDKLERMRQDIEVTHEYHRIGAIQGIVLDADGSTQLYDWFTEFGITELEVEFDFTADNNVKTNCATILRHMQDSLGADTFRSIHVFCSSSFYDALIVCDEVKAAYDRFQDGSFLRDQQARGSFEYPRGVTWEEYRGSIGAVDFIPANTARFVPIGASDVFDELYAPANFIETVNTVGKPVYAKQARMEFDMGIKLHSQSNPLMMCKRPSVLVKGVDANAGSS